MKTYIPITLLLLTLSGVIYLMLDSQPRKHIVEQTPSSREANIQVQSKSDQKQTGIQTGKTLFMNNCAACHNKNMRDDLKGPALRGATERWQNDTIGILNYLRSTKEYFKNKPNKRMVALHKTFGEEIKPNMEGLTIEELKAIIEYIDMDYYIMN